MIEISHQQAQQLVRDSMDSGSTPGGTHSKKGNRITQEQWGALQAHLESCAQCREYAQRIQTLEKDLTRTLHFRFSPVAGPQPGIFRQVVNTRAHAAARRKRMAGLFAILGVALVLALLFFARRAFFPAALAPTPTLRAVSRATAAPTPTRPGNFRGLLAFESRHEGNSEIYLLNAGSSGGDLTNLTQSPAQDTFPAWSPDGEWIAFLSDRSGKNEIYVLYIAGSRLTRLTANLNIDWRGPLSWSPDGSWIAARGLRLDQGNEAYLSLIPLDGRRGLRNVAYSRGAPASGVFSPESGSFAFLAAVPPGLLYDYSLLGGTYTPINSLELYADRMRATGSFAWALGESLFYLSEGPFVIRDAPQLLPDSYSQANLSPIVIDSGAINAINSSAWNLGTQPGLGAFRSAAWVPNSLISVTSQDSDQDGCWTLILHQAYDNTEDAVDLDGICLEGSLTIQSWTQAGTGERSWLVLRGRRPGQSSAAFLAVQFPVSLGAETVSPLTLPVEEIGVPGLANSANPADWPGEPQARPAGERLNIQPYEVQPVVASPPHRRPGSEVNGRLVVTRITARGTSLAGLRPAGGMQALIDEKTNPSCPVLSPDGQRLAYIALPEGSAAHSEVMVLPSGGGKPQPLTGLGSLSLNAPSENASLPSYGCPVWSPDGTQIAAEYRAGDSTYLALIPSDGSAAAVYLRIEPLSVPPFWASKPPGNGSLPGNGTLPDNGLLQSNGPLLLVYQRTTLAPLRIVTVDPASPANQAAAQSGFAALNYELANFPNVDNATAFSASADGKLIALLSVSYETNTTLLREARLHYGAPGNLVSFAIADYAPDRAGEHDLTWLTNDMVGLRHPLPFTGSAKTRIELYEPHVQSMVTVTQIDDETGSAVWSPDATWLFLGSESGLWAVDVNHALAGNASPVRLLADWVVDVNYR